MQRQTGSSSGIDSKTDAINASKLMDTILSTPSFHQSLFTDSVQLFPSHILQEARLQSTHSNNNNKSNNNNNNQHQKQPQDLTTIMTDLQFLVETTRIEIDNALSMVQLLRSHLSPIYHSALYLSSESD